MAINRQGMIDNIYGGKAALTASIPEGWGEYGLTQAELAEKHPRLYFLKKKTWSNRPEPGYKAVTTPKKFKLCDLCVTAVF